MSANNLFEKDAFQSILLSEDEGYPGFVFGVDPELQIIRVCWYKWGYHSDRWLDWMTYQEFKKFTVLTEEECIRRFGALPPEIS